MLRPDPPKFDFKMNYFGDRFRITMNDGTERDATKPETDMWRYIVMQLE